ncbi:AzlC family ABC transporter permease [Ahrensia sp. R2A130]|uniref:AzlC family ABC transporter permease n=1 Tax=Ahrensia sp. R2A130 TaxID=744979 RepID=UPI0001E0C9BE|nr:AzlC family ABC transporter permease [Ahrensia sp. R2A130]EFL90831.1 AzlC family protein [Ahrensia sp. R2A130]
MSIAPAPSERAEFMEGVRDSAPFVLSVFPFGLVVGALAIKSGGGAVEAMLQSVLFFAGASQIVMWELYGLSSPLWVIALAVFAVNFRLVLYSAAIGRKLEPLPKRKMVGALFLLQDLSLAVGLRRADEVGRLSWGYHMGLASVLYVVWLAATAVGIGFGSLITDPKAIGLDMLVPIYFMLLVMNFRTKPNAAAICGTSAVMCALVYYALGSPYHIAAGGIAGMALAAMLAKPTVSDAEAADV